MFNPLNLLRTEKLATDIQKDLKTMNRTNWKTNTCAALTAALMIASIWAPADIQAKIHNTEIALASVGLFAAKDGDK